MRRVGMVAAIGAIAACGTEAPPIVPAIVPTIALTSPPASPDDIEVAKVNGRAVWGSCVTRQAVGGKTRDAALHECIDFELLAQIAEQKHVEQDPEVLRTAMVDRLVATTYEAKYRKPADFGAMMDKALVDNARRMHRVEFRGSTILRVTITPERPDQLFPPNDPRDADARAIADRLAAQFVGQDGLLPPMLADAAGPERAGAAMKQLAVQYMDVAPYAIGGLDPVYGAALFAIPEIGQAAGPIRTKWGYDVILFTFDVPAKELTRDELAADIFAKLRVEYFPIWVKSIEKSLGIQVTYFEDNVAKLGEGS